MRNPPLSVAGLRCRHLQATIGRALIATVATTLIVLTATSVTFLGRDQNGIRLGRASMIEMQILLSCWWHLSSDILRNDRPQSRLRRGADVCLGRHDRHRQCRMGGRFKLVVRNSTHNLLRCVLRELAVGLEVLHDHLHGDVIVRRVPAVIVCYLSAIVKLLKKIL